jgi:hypothetical protein
LSDTDTTDGETVKGKGKGKAKVPEVEGDEDNDVIDVDDLPDAQVSVLLFLHSTLLMLTTAPEINAQGCCPCKKAGQTEGKSVCCDCRG